MDEALYLTISVAEPPRISTYANERFEQAAAPQSTYANETQRNRNPSSADESDMNDIATSSENDIYEDVGNPRRH